jgi:hypothetical protein
MGRARGFEELDERELNEQAERLLAQGSRGIALVLYDCLRACMREQGFSEEPLTYLGGKREESLYRPSLT